MQAELNARFSSSGVNPGASPSQKEDDNYGVCIANISPAERLKRLKFAIFQFVISLAILAAMLIIGVDKIWRLTLFLPLAAGASSYFQWRDKT